VKKWSSVCRKLFCKNNVLSPGCTPSPSSDVMYWILKSMSAATSSLLQGSFAKETCNFKEPTNRSNRTEFSKVSSTVIVHSIFSNNSFGVLRLFSLYIVYIWFEWHVGKSVFRTSCNGEPLCPVVCWCVLHYWDIPHECVTGYTCSDVVSFTGLFCKRDL